MSCNETEFDNTKVMCDSVLRSSEYKIKMEYKCRSIVKKGIIYLSRWMLDKILSYNHSIFKLMMHNESSILLRNHVCCNFMLKYYITVSCPQFTKVLNQFLRYLGQTIIFKFVCLFDLCNRMNESSFEVILLDNILINGHYLKNTKQSFR